MTKNKQLSLMTLCLKHCSAENRLIRVAQAYTHVFSPLIRVGAKSFSFNTSNGPLYIEFDNWCFKVEGVFFCFPLFGVARWYLRVTEPFNFEADSGPISI